MLLEKLVIPIGFDTGMLMAGIDAITGLITGAIDRTKEWTDGMDALGDVTGMSTDKLAAWSFVAQKAGVDIDTLSNATVIMSKGLLDSKGELSTTGKALQDFGIDVLDAGGKVRDQSDLMNDIAKKYAEFGTQTERVDFLTNVFGRSGAGLVDVFDTLAQEGGIDAVKTKVQELGLVLDPTQYEQFQRGLNEVSITLTGLSNTFLGPLLPGAQGLLKTFTDWLQSPWVIEAIAGIGEKLGTLATDISTGLQTGSWDSFFMHFQEFTGVDIEPLMITLGKFSSWITDTGIPKFKEFVDSVKTGFSELKDNTQVETSAIAGEWKRTLENLGLLMDEIFGTKGTSLIINWQGVATTALQLVDLFIYGLSQSFENFRKVIIAVKDLFKDLGNTKAWGSVIGNSMGGGGVPGYASGGMAGGLSWVGERGPELLNLPGGSRVSSNSSSMAMVGSESDAIISAIRESAMSEERLSRLIVSAMQQGK